MESLSGGRHRPVLAILVGGGIAASLDLTYAIVVSGQHGKSAVWVMQSVASGALGSQAFEQGIGGALLGVVAHYSILLVAATIYHLASRHIPILRSRAVACGALFGVLVYLFMNFVVLPLSAFPYHLSYPPIVLLRGFVSHAVLVGLPIALAIRKLTQPVA